MLRMSTSRSPIHTPGANAASSAASGQGKANSAANRAGSVQDNIKGGGPPFKDFNTGICVQQGGHMVEGVRRLHICSFCLVNISAIHPHPEQDCRIKKGQPSNTGKCQIQGFQE